ncbi:MAG: branched-chain amino acid aminotransferase [Weeksellaceae bacterium]|jgi:branched-chain amino acid aminotransferase|nr:branched-chain amino acid aminotransferase [Weeksellaceae bacterium]MDX9704850.1 branched-chain amino acid aminotransferase [Weeksellaceae bacterium]
MIIEKIEKSRFTPEIFDIKVFGTAFADHMLLSWYEDGKWSEPLIKPYGKLEFSPALSVAHYGQGIFEGMKAYKGEKGNVFLFRPERNFERFNQSAVRMNMPQIPEEIFLDGMKTLIDLDREWVPATYGMSLYIRPVMFAVEEAISARPSTKYLFAILTAVAPNYYDKPLSVKIADRYSRAANGGVGYVKAAGNYAGSFYPTQVAREEGYDQVVWTDDATHTLIEEAGTMNVFIRIGDKLITGPTSERILDGVTRDSIIRLAEDAGIEVEIRKITVEEVYNAYKTADLKEVFGVGTAVVVNNYNAIGYKDERLELQALADEESYGKVLKKKLVDLQMGKVEDPYNWRVKVETLVEA